MRALPILDPGSATSDPRPPVPGPVPLQAQTPEALSAFLGCDLAEARKLVSRVHGNGQRALEAGGEPLGSPVTGVRRIVMDAARARTFVPELTLVTKQESQVDPFVKYALRTSDNCVLETVRIPLERSGRFSVCVSSQVGCGLGCAFCATGRMGLVRNLEVWEIVEQVRVVRAGLRGAAQGRVHGVVFQGMGEPMANLDRVLQAIAVLREPSALAVDARAMTVCTAGVAPGVHRLADDAPNVRLGVSIGSARPEVRQKLMPIEARYPLLGPLADAIVYHAHKTQLAPMLAVAQLAGVNDTPDDAAALADFVAVLTSRMGLRPRLSIIPYNPIGAPDTDPFVRAPEEALRTFRDALAARGAFSHVRYSGGGDVNAACGQLATAQTRAKRPRATVSKE
jgi:23S rRNA (adenine2503-C2)-methyltransferase